MTEKRYVNARVVTAEGDFLGGVVVADGRIVATEPSLSAAPGAEDLDGDVLIPGVVDIHTDNLERHYQPRPGVHWDGLGAVLAHDSQMVSVGITTVFDSLSLHGEKKGFDRGAALAPMLTGLAMAREEGIFRADHFLHLRCEVTNPDLLGVVEPQLDNPMLRLLSVMDHSPGQGQWRTMTPEMLRKLSIAHGATDAEVDERIEEWQSGRIAQVARANRDAILQIARERGLPLASHDDETADQVIEVAGAGATISEFPVTFEAVGEARKRGLAVFMGAPNLVRGKSHSGNISAHDIALAGNLDGLASDYVPMAMLRAAFRLVEPPFGMTLSAAIATVTATPARTVGLDDRGVLAPGKRADMVRVALSRDGWPIVRGVWREGVRVS